MEGIRRSTRRWSSTGTCMQSGSRRSED
jgi:hypothetical protein